MYNVDQELSGRVLALHSVVTGLIMVYTGEIMVYTGERSNKVKTAVQWFHMLHAVLAGFSGLGSSIYNIIPLLKKRYVLSLYWCSPSIRTFHHHWPLSMMWLRLHFGV